ncbi:hypothetical protein NO559_07815 [Dasania sp. GY-MA-18]|uniref:Uncharacterized protein n=1 Tax=Dasania phycosphaerae TaxID=2950436 RepID=A0A9J6RK80_9GAMM|nr:MULTISPECIES: hypothetical protein [Dasania]MCR8922672.1 hypothetical protein [Dasania sp. GY-MA-18]MCZ0865102.1 hypothetical protein [Dasania phycosphaerae]MCZ0868828.1 hypothetical protein [Dasania phycosphaerae]
MDWSLPSLSSAYANFKDLFKSRDEELGKMDFTGATNLPAGFIQYNRTNKRWEEWNGTAWAELEAEFAIKVANAVTADKLNNQLPSYYLDCANFTGTLATGRIPNLDAGKVTTGSFSTGRIPNLDAGKITSGTFGTSRLDMNGIAGHAAIIAKINELINNRFTVNGSELDIDTSV